MGAEKINQIWRDAKLRAVGKKRAQTLVEAAQRSIGYTKGLDMARLEISMLFEDYERLEKHQLILEWFVKHFHNHIIGLNNHRYKQWKYYYDHNSNKVKIIRS